MPRTIEALSPTFSIVLNDGRVTATRLSENQALGYLEAWNWHHRRGNVQSPSRMVRECAAVAIDDDGPAGDELLELRDPVRRTGRELAREAARHYRVWTAPESSDRDRALAIASLDRLARDNGLTSRELAELAEEVW